MKKNIVKLLILIFVPIVLIVIFYAIVTAYKKKKPGLYFKHECESGGKLNSKLNNWNVTTFICSGAYIPFGVKLNGKDYIKVLEKMKELNNASVPTTEKEMKELAKKAVEQTI